MTAFLKTIGASLVLFMGWETLLAQSTNTVAPATYPAESVSPEAAFEQLDACSPIEYVLTPEVRNYIDQILLHRPKDLTIYLERSRAYFPYMESMLDRYELPLELKYLAVVESSLNPQAKSASGAVGLWQFLYGTATLFGLTIDSYIDERKDPYKSTEAACRYLDYLYRTFGDWNLVMAAYNGGPGEVRKAIERSGGKTNYWELRPFLSHQAQQYVPAFMAISYLMTHPPANLQPKDSLYPRSIPTDTLMLTYAVSFAQIQSVLGIPAEELQRLNPQYRKHYLPKMSSPALLVLPEAMLADYLRNEPQIRGGKLPQKDYHQLCAEAGTTENRVHHTHTVQKGEYAHKIAVDYQCTIENLKAWNHLDSLELYPGQVLNIWLEE